MKTLNHNYIPMKSSFSLGYPHVIHGGHSPSTKPESQGAQRGQARQGIRELWGAEDGHGQGVVLGDVLKWTKRVGGGWG